MKIRRLEAPRISAHISRWHSQRAAKGDAKMGKIAAYAGPLRHNLIGRGERVRGAADIIDIVVNPIAYRRNALIPRRKIPESSLRKPVEAVRLAIPARIEMGQHAERKFTRWNLEHICRIFGRMT